jgi:mono/diheme cytochrome c family protein
MKNLTRSLILMTGLAGLVAGRDLFAQPGATPPPMPQPAAARPVFVPPAMPPPVAQPSLDSLIKWDAERKDVTVASGTPQAQFTFNLTNVSAEVVTINSATTSCGCTVASLPEQPWKLAPGKNGQISATMNLLGKSGTTVKTINVVSDKGSKMLYVQTTILPAAAPTQALTAMDRESNQKLAIADRQAVFKGDCARCHAQPALNKFGQPLYVAVCGVCHESEHRATMVSNLHAIPQETNAEFWKNWIAHGKPGTLMPAFSLADGGILSDEQITSLVSYLVATIPSKPALQAIKPTASAN